MCKASIAAVLLAFGIIALVQEGTNAMVMRPAGFGQRGDIELCYNDRCYQKRVVCLSQALSHPKTSVMKSRQRVVGYFDCDLPSSHLARTSPPPITTKPILSSMETIAAGP